MTDPVIARHLSKMTHEHRFRPLAWEDEAFQWGAQGTPPGNERLRVGQTMFLSDVADQAVNDTILSVRRGAAILAIIRLCRSQMSWFLAPSAEPS
jgi:hypothetical protein